MSYVSANDVWMSWCSNSSLTSSRRSSAVLLTFVVLFPTVFLLLLKLFTIFESHTSSFTFLSKSIALGFWNSLIGSPLSVLSFSRLCFYWAMTLESSSLYAFFFSRTCILSHRSSFSALIISLLIYSNP